MKTRTTKGLEKEGLRRANTRQSVGSEQQSLLCRVVKVYYPGEVHNYELAKHLNNSVVRVQVEPMEGQSSGFRDIMSRVCFPLEVEPHLFAMLVGVDGRGTGGLIGKLVRVEYVRNSILTGVCRLEGTSYSRDTGDVENAAAHKAIRFDLGMVLLG